MTQLLVKRADIKTGWSCNCNCLFCVVGDYLFTGDRSTQEVLKELVHARKTSNGVVFTGGEPTMRKDFLDLVRFAKKLRYDVIQVQTNGRMYAYEDFVDGCIEAGVTEFSPAIHGHTAKLHDGLVRQPGAFDQIVAGIRHLRQRNQRIVTNTVVNRANMKHLKALAAMLCDLEVNQFQLAFIHPQGHVQKYFQQMVPPISKAAPFVHEALLEGERRGVACMAEAMPYCHMQGYERFVSELYIPPTEIHFEDLKMDDYKANRIAMGKLRFEQCRQCRWEAICEGPWREYPERMGSEEFVPVPGPKILTEQLVMEGVFTRLGELAPDFALADATGRLRQRSEFLGKPLVVYFYPEDESPGCTLQACGLRDSYAEIQALGAGLLGVSPDPPESHARFQANHGLPFTLLSDPGGRVADAHGLWRQGLRRGTVILDENGRWLHWTADESPAGHAQRVLGILNRLGVGQGTGVLSGV